MQLVYDSVAPQKYIVCDSSMFDIRIYSEYKR